MIEDQQLRSVEQEQTLFDNGLALAEEDLNVFQNKVREYSDESKPVIIVGHSQGSFYANQVYRLVDNRLLIAPLLVATSASNSEGPLKIAIIKYSCWGTPNQKPPLGGFWFI